MKLPHSTLIVAPLIVAASFARVQAAAPPLPPPTDVAALWAPSPLAGGGPPVVVDSPRPRPRPTGSRARGEPASAAPLPNLLARLA
jgi:hypothetical protein